MPLFALPIIYHRHINNLEKVLLFNVHTFNIFRLEQFMFLTVYIRWLYKGPNLYNVPNINNIPNLCNFTKIYTTKILLVPNPF